MDLHSSQLKEYKLIISDLDYLVQKFPIQINQQVYKVMFVIPL